MVTDKIIKQKFRIFAVLVFMLAGLSITARAETLPCRTATAVGSYKDPKTGIIEDSGGEENAALGESMVANVIDSEALVEETVSGTYYVSLRMHLMDNISEVSFSVRTPDSDTWEKVTGEQTASEGEQADFRIPVETEDSAIRTECYVEPMGRSVIFYVTLSDFTDGNQGGFAQMDQEDADLLEGVTGLTTGGTAEKKDAILSNASSESTADSGPQQLNLSAGVWMMLFITIFCANLLAGLVLLGIRTLLFKENRRMSGSDEEEEWQEADEKEENEGETLPDLTELDWEELKHDTKE